MIFSPTYLVSFLSHQFTMPAGTIILTGTPPGVGYGRKPQVFLKPGDEVVVEIESIGQLKNHVMREKHSVG
jgi:2-keto-4-pentenoate hydratase/2-oxohepta-3-ene-1,7-dioic acid hydratase in catechol pathway